jgi:hypothetical protein
MDEKILAELAKQTALLQEMGASLGALRSEMKASGKEAIEKATKEAIEQVSSMFANTPMGPMLQNMMKRSMEKAGGKSYGK